MSPTTRDGNHHTKARQRRRRTAQERLAHDRLQAQQAALALEQALYDLGLPDNLVAELAGRLRSQQQLLGKIRGVMFPPLFGCRTYAELCRVRVVYPHLADNCRASKTDYNAPRLLLDSRVVDKTMSYNPICASCILLEALIFQEPYKCVA